MVIEIAEHRVSVNGQQVSDAMPIEKAHRLFGPPSRIEDCSSTPAPYGHRNGQTHYYDYLGITLGEDHYTYTISHFDFVFDIDEYHRPTCQAFGGLLDLNGYVLRPGALESDLRYTGLDFTSQLAGSWSYPISSGPLEKRLSVWVSTIGPKLPSGRRSKKKKIVYVSVCLKHNPWNRTYRPVK